MRESEKTDKLSSVNSRNRLVIGIGNANRRDDAVGLIVARALREEAPGIAQVLEANGEGTALMESWKQARAVFLIDAVQSGAPPGTIHRFDARAQAIAPNFFRYSTHAFGIAEAIELGRALNQLPLQLVVYGIEGANFGAGEGLTPMVTRAAKQVVQAVLAELQFQAKK
jgi:hydrogenase maturation protease